MIVIGAYVAGHSYLVPLWREAAANPLPNQKRKSTLAEMLTTPVPCLKKWFWNLDSRMYYTNISLDSTIKSAGNDKPQNRRCSQCSENRTRGHAGVCFMHLDAIISSRRLPTPSIFLPLSKRRRDLRCLEYRSRIEAKKK
jgi:hypothetical protein